MAINLQKGQRISLEKNTGKLQNVCVGINWGVIEKKGFFGMKSKEAVDLDASCVLYDANKKLTDVVYFGNLKSKCQSVRHSGDDLTGDINGNDGLDNEVISMDLGKLDPSVNYAAFVLNSYKGQDFGTIPFASIRIFEGNTRRVDEVFAKFDVANDPSFKGNVSMVMGVFYKRDGEWKFNAIGEPTRDKNLEESVKTLPLNHL